LTIEQIRELAENGVDVSEQIRQLETRAATASGNFQ